MKKHTILAIPLAVLVLVAAPAVAGDGKGADKDKPAHAQPHPATPPMAYGQHDNGKHKGWEKQAWKRGDRIPLAYVDSRYYINDYRVYRLQPPPAGYRWVRPMDDRYLLVNLANGLVAEALGY